MKILIDGTDITDFIAFRGLKWSRNDIDAQNAGRALDGTMIRDRVATKIRLDISCRPLKAEELRQLLNLIQAEYVSVQYDDPMMGHRTGTFYANNNPASYCMMAADGTEWWHDVSFPLVER